jgi:chromate transporter
MQAVGFRAPDGSARRAVAGECGKDDTMAVKTPPAATTAPAHPTLAEAFRVWARIALLSFGGPAGQIALMHRILVEERRWLGERRFLHALNFCMLLPGPEAQQLAVYIGWLMHRTLGGVIAGVLFVLPGMVAIMGLSWVYALHGNVGVVAALFFGLKAAVLAIVLQALVRIGGRALRNGAMLTLAGVSFVAIFAFDVPFPLIVLGAALVGYLGARAGLAAFGTGSGGAHGPVAGQVAEAETVLGTATPEHARVGMSRSFGVGLLFLLIWLAPTLALLATLGPGNVFTAIAVFFSQMAVVTFGGAYAVLAWVAQEAVGTHGWLAPGEMLDGLGMAETTPGPLIMVTQFVGFMGAFREAGGLDPLLAGTLGGLLATWVTFAPCFAWIFLGAPYMERLRDNRALAAALSAITAAVVGVILNLAVWFGLHVVFARVERFEGFGLRLDLPVPGSVDPVAAALVALALVAVFRMRAGLFAVLGGCAGAGLVLHLFGLA